MNTETRVNLSPATSIPHQSPLPVQYLHQMESTTPSAACRQIPEGFERSAVASLLHRGGDTTCAEKTPPVLPLLLDRSPCKSMSIFRTRGTTEAAEHDQEHAARSGARSEKTPPPFCLSCLFFHCFSRLLCEFSLVIELLTEPLVLLDCFRRVQQCIRQLSTSTCGVFPPPRRRHHLCRKNTTCATPPVQKKDLFMFFWFGPMPHQHEDFHQLAFHNRRLA